MFKKANVTPAARASMPIAVRGLIFLLKRKTAIIHFINGKTFVDYLIG